MNGRDSGRAAGLRVVKALFAAAALGSLLAGLAIYIFAGALGLEQDTAELIALVFLAAGVTDYLVLRFWDRLFPRE